MIYEYTMNVCLKYHIFMIIYCLLYLNALNWLFEICMLCVYDEFCMFMFVLDWKSWVLVLFPVKNAELCILGAMMTVIAGDGLTAIASKWKKDELPWWRVSAPVTGITSGNELPFMPHDTRHFPPCYGFLAKTENNITWVLNSVWDNVICVRKLMHKHIPW